MNENIKKDIINLKKINKTKKQIYNILKNKYTLGNELKTEIDKVYSFLENKKLEVTTFRFKQKGFEIKYKNGLSASVIFNKYAYCEQDNKGNFISFELAVFNKEDENITNKIFKKEISNIIAYEQIDKLDFYLNKIKKYNTKK